MSSTKCRDCGFPGSVADRLCRRCGKAFVIVHASRINGPREAAKRSSWLYTLLIITLLVGCAYYLFNGVEKSYDQVNADEVNRMAAQPRQSSSPLTSRIDYDHRRAEPYKNAVANSPGLATSQKHNDEINNLIQPGGQKK